MQYMVEIKVANILAGYHVDALIPGIVKRLQL